MRPLLFHVDLDAFYASVEEVDNPELKNKPVIVGGLGARSVVSSCSYEARRYGVHSAMPISQARRKCPHAIFLPVRMNRYLEVSEQVMAILESYSPVFQQISIDEAYLDLSGTERLYGPELKLAQKIKNRIRVETRLSISIGIAANKYLAKLASEYGKPDGLFKVAPGEEITFLDKLKLNDLWGVGEKTHSRLLELNITSVERLRRFPQDILCSMLGKACGLYLYRAVRGFDPGIFLPESETRSRSLSSEITFESDKKNPESIKMSILEISDQIMYRLIRGGWKANTVFLKLRYFDFTTVSAQKTLKHWITSSDELYQIALELLKQKWDGSTPIRLIGAGTANLVKEETVSQGELFEDQYLKKRKVEEAVTRIRKRNAGVKLTKASLLNKKRRS